MKTQVIPRRNMNDVYMESDRDYVMNNLQLCVRFLDYLQKPKPNPHRKKAKPFNNGQFGPRSEDC